jgi:hypothetical protein
MLFVRDGISAKDNSNNNMLYWTSFGFGIVSMLFFKDHHCGIAKHVLNMLMGTSILHHAKKNDVYRGKKLLMAVDKTLAHTVTIAAIAKAFENRKKNGRMRNALHIATASYITFIYHIANLCHKPLPHGDVYHGSLHLAAFIGLASVAIK